MDFELVLFFLLLISGFFWVLDYSYFKNLRKDGETRSAFLEYTAGFFPVILIVFVIRSFLVEPFNIPSGSMIPTLRIGDLILVNKFEYGVKLPVLDKNIFANKKPQRGDVAVFKWPRDKSLDYIKRVIALPGDKLEYVDKKIIVNDTVIIKNRIADYLDPSTYKVSEQYNEVLEKRTYKVLNDFNTVDFYFDEEVFKSSCKKVTLGISCVVPDRHYFVLGDNRDNSSDSRYWGFVPETNLVGKAVLVWFNIYDILDGRFDRLGFIN